jgi:alpha-beta hydrolase superfamily lysophospholipase
MPEALTIPCTGYDIAADWYQGENTSRILLVLPGFQSTKTKQQGFIAAVLERTDMSALAIDYSGHGESPFELGDTRPAQHFLEVVCAFDELKSRYPNAQILVSGSSYGSFLAVQLTKYREVSKLVLKNPAIFRPEAFYDPWARRLQAGSAYIPDMAAYRQGGAALSHHPLLARASQFKGKTLVVVHELDEVVPIEVSNAYITAFNADSFVAKGFPHAPSRGNLSASQLADYRNRIVDWLG